MGLRSIVVVALSFGLITSVNSPIIAGDRGISVEPRPIAAPHTPAPNFEKSHALIIGIDNYTNGWPKLKNAVKDAELIAAEMRRRGFDVTLSKNPNSKQLKEIFETFYITKGADPEARLFVWYAGHGHTLQGDGFLVPTDAPVPHFSQNISDRNIVDFKLKSLNMSRFNEYVRLAASDHTYTVFDSCFGGKIFGSSSEQTSIARLEDRPSQPTRHFLTSGTSDQKVADDGRFRRLFLQALNGETAADINQDGILAASEIGKFMTRRYAKMTDGKQTPRAANLNFETAFAGEFTFHINPTPQPQFLAETTPLPPVDIWTYDKGSFERIVFDWPTKVAYSLERVNARTRVTFDIPADFKIEPLTDQKMRNVKNVNVYRSKTSTIVTLNIPNDRYVHDFVEGNQIVLDVVNPPVTEVAATNQNPVKVISYPAPAPEPTLPVVIARSLPKILASALQNRPRPVVQQRLRQPRYFDYKHDYTRWTSRRQQRMSGISRRGLKRR